jgi:acyl-homoserine lactone acylase PvdQ
MTQDEEMALRELAAKPHYLPQVAAALGPMSLWSKDGLEAEIRRAVEAEREACAKLCEEEQEYWGWDKVVDAASLIRARGEQA